MKYIKVISLIIISLVLINAKAFTQQNIIVSIADFKINHNIAIEMGETDIQNTLNTIANQLSSIVSSMRLRGLKIISSSGYKSSQEGNYTRYSYNNLIQTGAMASANYIFTGTLDIIDKQIIFNAEIVDIETGIIVSSILESVNDIKSSEDIFLLMENAIKEIMYNLVMYRE